MRAWMTSMSSSRSSKIASQYSSNAGWNSFARELDGAMVTGAVYAVTWAPRGPRAARVLSEARCVAGGGLGPARHARTCGSRPPVRAVVRRRRSAEPDRGAGRGLGAHRPRRATLLCAPTGSGKTLAAFLWAIDRLRRATAGRRGARGRVLYVSPLRALAVDVEKNLRSPLPRHRARGRAARGALRRAHRRGAHRRHPATRAAGAGPHAARHPHHHARVALPDAHLGGPRDARRASRPSSSTRSTPSPPPSAAPTSPSRSSGSSSWRSAGARAPQRIGLSATQRPLDEIARFLGGLATGEPRRPRPVTIVDAGVRKELDLEVIVPVDDMGALGEIVDEPSRGPAPALQIRARHLAVDPPAAARADRVAPLHARLRQRPPAGRAAGDPAQRAGRRRRPRRAAAEATSAAPVGPTRSGRGRRLVKAHHGSLSRERRLHIEDELKPGELRGLVATQLARARHRHGRRRPRDPGRVARLRSPRACSASAAPATRWARPAGASSSPSTAATCSRRRSWSQRMRDGADRAHPLPAQPARRAGPADRGHGRARRVAGRRARPRSCAAPANFAELSDERPRERARPARRPLPAEEFAELRPRLVWDRVDGVVRGRAGRAAPGGHQRRHHPRPRPVRRVPARRHPGRRARRGDGLREPARRDVPARRVHLAHRGHHPRAGGRHPGAGPARQDAVLARRRPGPPARARPGARRVRARASAPLPARRGAAPPARPTTASTSWPPPTCSPTSTSRPRPPASCPTTAPSSSSASATRSATGGSASSRRSAPGCTRRGRWPSQARLAERAGASTSR